MTGHRMCFPGGTHVAASGTCGWWEVSASHRVGLSMGFPGGKEPTCQCRRCRFDPQVRKIPWRRKWQPTQIFLPGEPRRQRSLPGYSPWGFKGIGQDLATKQQQVSPRHCLNVLVTWWLASYRASGLRGGPRWKLPSLGVI